MVRSCSQLFELDVSLVHLMESLIEFTLASSSYFIVSGTVQEEGFLQGLHYNLSKKFSMI